MLDMRGVVAFRFVELEAFSTAKEAAVAEHVAALGVQGPEVALAGSAGGAGNLDEAVVERQVVADRVLPPLLVLLERRTIMSFIGINSA